MSKVSIKLGVAPTRRSIFSAPAAIEFAKKTCDRLSELGIDYVDIYDINEEGLLYNDTDMEKIAEIISLVIESGDNVEKAKAMVAELTAKYPLC